MSALQHHAHIVFARECECMRSTPLTVELQTKDLMDVGGFIDMIVKNDAGAVLIKSVLTNKLAEHGIVRIDLEPVIRVIRKHRDLELGPISNKRRLRTIEFPCLYAFQDWIETNPSMFVTVDNKPVVELDLMTMRSYYTFDG